MYHQNRASRRRAASLERRRRRQPAQAQAAAKQLQTHIDDPRGGEMVFSAGTWGDAAIALCERHSIPFEIQADGDEDIPGDVVIDTRRLTPEQRQALSDGVAGIMSH